METEIVTKNPTLKMPLTMEVELDARMARFRDVLTELKTNLSKFNEFCKNCTFYIKVINAGY